MNPKFREMVDAIHPAFERLRSAQPHVLGSSLPRKGVYLFCEKETPIYVGRSNDIPRRYGQHKSPGAPNNQAALASLIATRELGLEPDYRSGAQARLLANESFMIASHRARQRILAMEFRAIEEADPLKQALIEVYCAIALGTPYNNL